MDSRRAVLKTGASIGAVAIAGCSDLLASGSDSSEAALYADFVTETVDRPVTVEFEQPSRLASVEEYSSLDPDDRYIGVGPDAVESAVFVTLGQHGPQADGYGLLSASLPVETVRAGLEEQFQGVTERESMNGFQTLEVATGTEQIAYFGVGDNSIVLGSDRDLYETAVNAANGDTSSLFDSNDALGLLEDSIGKPAVGEFELAPMRSTLNPTGDAVATGEGIEVAQGESPYTAGIVYETARGASSTEFEIANAIIGNRPGVDDVETTVDDRTVIVTATATTSEL